VKITFTGGVVIEFPLTLVPSKEKATVTLLEGWLASLIKKFVVWPFVKLRDEALI
jgi:hypothetical protein